MSFQVEKEAWALIESGQFKLTDSDKLILVKLAFWANGDRECWHGIEGIVVAGVSSRSQAINSLKKLATINVLSKRPRPRSEGRGRATDLIVVNPAAAKSKSRTLVNPDQSPDSGAAKSKSTPQQSPNSGTRTNRGTGKALETGTGKDARPSSVGPRKRHLPLPTIDGLKVTEAELVLADAALTRFNERNGSKLNLLGRANRASQALTRIVMRIREHPDLDAAALEQIVDKNFDAPWWKEDKLGGVGPIFGPEAWPRAMACDGIARSNRRDRRGIDRAGKSKKGPSW